MTRILITALLLIAAGTAYAGQAGNTSDSERSEASRRQSGCNPCYNQ